MKIGIEVNGVLRDTIEKFKQVYEKVMIDGNQSELLNQTYELDMSGNTEENTEIPNFEYKIIFDLLYFLSSFSYLSYYLSQPSRF